MTSEVALAAAAPGQPTLPTPALSPALARWTPSRRPPRHPPRTVPHRLLVGAGLDAGREPENWTLIDIEVADDLGPVRTGMTYNRDYTTSAGFFEKSGRTQFLEGPNEPAVADHLEMNPRYLAFLFQPMGMRFRRADGKIIVKYPDVAIELFDHRVLFGEIKTNGAWFAAPGIRRPLDRMDRALAERGLGPLLRIKGEAFRSDETLEAHALAMEARLTRFDKVGEARAVREFVTAAGGRATYAAVVAALGGRRALAVDKLYAMLLRRIIDFDLSAPPSDRTVVTLPRPATPYALRDLLAGFRRKAA